MKHFLFSVLILTALIIGSFSECYSQNEKLDFKASWKTVSTKNLIAITITKGNLPVNCYIYESSPFNGGKLIKQIENIVTKEFEIEMNKIAKVYICIYKDENSLAAKWLKISK